MALSLGRGYGPKPDQMLLLGYTVLYILNHDTRGWTVGRQVEHGWVVSVVMAMMEARFLS